jgi:hypothetical protein
VGASTSSEPGLLKDADSNAELKALLEQSEEQLTEYQQVRVLKCSVPFSITGRQAVQSFVQDSNA